MHKVLLFLGPVVFLCGVALLMSRKPQPVRIINEPFRLTLQETRLEPLTPREVYDGYDTKLAVVLDHRGATPKWWGQEKGRNGSSDGNWKLRYAKNGKLRPVIKKDGYEPVVMKWQAGYDEKSNRYIAHYLLTLRDVPAGDEIRIQDRMTIWSLTAKAPLCPPIWVDVPVRVKGKISVLPKVSRDPGLAIESFEIDQTPPILQMPNPHYRVRLFLRRRGMDAVDSSAGVWADTEIQDARGERMQTFGSMGLITNEFWATELPQQPAVRTREIFQYEFYLASSTPPAPKELWIAGEAYRGERWPIKIRFPFRDRNGRVLETSRVKPEFRVVSASAVKPANQNDGADTVIKIVVQAIGNPQKPVKNWNWNAHYSQHVVDAGGKKYWKFPLRGKMRISAPVVTSVGAGKNQMFIYYPLNLSRIPRSAGTLTFKTELGANRSQRVPVQVIVRP